MKCETRSVRAGLLPAAHLLADFSGRVARLRRKHGFGGTLILIWVKSGVTFGGFFLVTNAFIFIGLSGGNIKLQISEEYGHTLFCGMFTISL